MITLSPEQEQYMQMQMSRAYCNGIREGIVRYAHWRDGTQYVGTTGRTLDQALADIDQEEADLLARYNRLKTL